MAQSPNKRSRIAASYQHFVPIGDDFLDVHSREGHVKTRNVKSGQKIVPTPSIRVTQKSNEQWRLVTSWAPPDDTEFALDSSMAYDEALEAPVMEENNPPQIEKEKARSKLSVSRFNSLFNSFDLFSCLHATEATSRCLERTSSRHLPG
jgi:hypothetical protein